MKGLDTSIQFLKTIGPKKAQSFENLGLKTVRDLLFYFPSQYLDRTTILSSEKIAYYVANGFDSEVTIIGKVTGSEIVNSYKKKILKIFLQDSEGVFEAVFFNGIKYFSSLFKVNEFYAISAKPKITRYGHLQFVHPDFDKLSSTESEEFSNTGKIIPYYRIPQALREKKVGDVNFRNLIRTSVHEYSSELTEILPENFLSENKLIPIQEMIQNIHFPENKEKLEQAWQRVKFEELFFYELLVAYRKKSISKPQPYSQITLHSEPIKNFLEALPFTLTEDQLTVLHEIRTDLESNIPMNRLLQGDVGSGKTIVAQISALMTIFSGKQAIIMVPTEILANQHFLNSSKLISDEKVKIGLLLGSQTKAERKLIEEQISSGEINLIIGTHAVFQDKINFANLGLVVIDEQHRFGVEQRLRLIQKGIAPNVLIMTATPIPRTLSLTLYGDLEVSTIKNLPPNRKEITTVLRNENKLDAVFDFIKTKIVEEDYQIYMVFPLVEESEKIELKAATEEFEKLKTNHFSGFKLGLIHGKMSWEEKQNIMQQFANKEFQILVSTTVIEVGMDVPNANIIVINEANRFGLSQLHQLRGRVGRGKTQAYCILITKQVYSLPKNPKFSLEFLSKSEIEKNKTAIRLDAIVKTSDGFKLSEIDLKLRGPGDIFGKRQSGMPVFKYVNLVEDSQILFQAQKAAFKLIQDDFKLEKPKNKEIKRILKEIYFDKNKFLGIA